MYSGRASFFLYLPGGGVSGVIGVEKILGIVMSECSGAVKESYVVPDCENIRNLGPGCFVRIQKQSENVWVEITSGEGDRFSGIMHPELSGSAVAKSASAEDMAVILDARQINALGCERFCYCD
jgi:hypothetical protein